jgi:hypothetical protein
MKKWTKEDEDILKELYPYGGYKVVQDKICRSRKSILQRADRLGIKVIPEYKSKILSDAGKLISSKYSGSGEKNANWKGGISKDNYRYKLKSISKYPEKDNARKLLATAIKSGKVKRMSCSVCGDVKSEAHHEDYTNPYDVVWLCRKHHIERHEEL